MTRDDETAVAEFILVTRMLRRRLGSGLRLYGAWLWEAGIHDYTAPMSATGQIKEKRGKQQKSLSNQNQLEVMLVISTCSTSR